MERVGASPSSTRRTHKLSETLPPPHRGRRNIITIMANRDIRAYLKRSSAQANLQIGRFSHVAIPVRTKKAKPPAVLAEASDDDEASDYAESGASASPQSDDFDSNPDLDTSPEPDADADESEAHGVDLMEMDEPATLVEKARPKPQRRKTEASGKRPTKSRGIDTNLPPLSNIEDIFKDITQLAMENGFNKTLDALNGHELRIATMCSGTESPVLALELVSEALQQIGKSLRLRHVFSAEIVPKKQAYIERNFHPPIIFRDIRELTKEDAFEAGATNVYGAKVAIPGNVDLLVAGFSCVDFSSLNNKGKTLSEKGESRDTLEAILSYAEKWKPKIIVLENVFGAPWPKCVERAKKVGYAADFVRVDTKDYYLPHTRTRGYMVCIHKEQFPGPGSVHSAVSKWKELMLSFKRRASAPASDFLLPADDHRVHQFNSQLNTQYRQDSRDRTVNWDACRIRHQKVRTLDRLGSQRPITQWIDSGSCVTFENAHKMWFSKQVERVWDSIEIRFLRAAKDNGSGMPGYDPMFKTSIMELSQNVDRFAQEMPFGICSCITPSGIFYLTDRGGPLTPYETLALQGLPLDKISFTIETMRELQDLAGNAMSSTVVGVAQLAALIVASPALKQVGPPANSRLSTAPKISSYLRGEDDLQPIVYEDLGSSRFSVSRLCKDALESVRLCRCEGRFGSTDYEILVCKECGHSVCTGCKSKPTHACTTGVFNRSITAHGFELRWKHHFPSELHFSTHPHLPSLGSGYQMDESLRAEYFEIVKTALKGQFKFQTFQRTSKWAIHYESHSAFLNLEIGDVAEWRLFVKAPAKWAGNHPLRDILKSPIARAKMPMDLDPDDANSCWADDWEWFVPSTCRFQVSVQEATEDVNPSWRALYGMVEYQKETVPQRLNVTVHPDDAQILPKDFSGIYRHLPACGTACSSLYRRVSGSGAHITSEMEANPLYLFLDPSRIGPVDQDSFLFSHSHERLEYNEERDVVARLEPSFRPWIRKTFQTHGYLTGVWVQGSTETELLASHKLLVVKGPSNISDWGTIVSQDCSQSLAVLSLDFQAEDRSGGSREYRFDARKGTAFMKAFSWVLATNAHLPSLKEWRRLDIGDIIGHCDACGPTLPTVRWAQSDSGRGNNKGAFVAQEDPEEAAQYELRMKARPSILDMTAVVDESNVCRLRAGLNVVSLAHRALAHLRPVEGTAVLSWNLTTEYVPPTAPRLRPFRLLSNINDREHEQPKRFRLDLRPTQRKSLFWMRQQEREKHFTLQEVAEEVIEPIRWKVEAKAEVDMTVRGGVIADQVSYGKTITSLALIHAGFCESQTSASNDGGLIPLKATLVLVPNNLPNQWMQEALKCLPSKDYASGAILKIRNANELKSLRVEDFRQAKIIIASFSLLGKDFYAQQLANVSAVPEVPASDGRQYEAWFKYCLKRIPDLNDQLKDLGVSSFKRYLKDELEKTRSHKDFSGIIPSKRTKGASYKSFEELEDQTTRSNHTKAPGTAKSYPRKADWERWEFPVFHQFKFNRVIIDEFHYLRDRDYTALVTLSADKRWILSGTPPLGDFADVKRFAAFLGVNLGIDWDTPGVITRENSKQMRKEKTSFELFQTFSERRSPTWHERRHQHAQTFLDMFARQNYADIGDVKCYESLRSVPLALDHRAIYEELSSYLKGRNMAMAGVSSAETGDRAKKLRQAMRNFETAEEALVNCSSVRIEAVHQTSACNSLIEQRDAELKEQGERLRKYILEASKLARLSGDPKNEWAQWTQRYRGVGLSAAADPKSQVEIRKMILKAEAEYAGIGNKRSADAAASLQTLVRTKVGAEARKFTNMRRSLRYARSISKVKSALRGVKQLYCECGDASHETTAELSSVIVGCGHVVCSDCLDAGMAEERCGVLGCEMEIREHGVLHGASLRGCEDVAAGPKSFGSKLDSVMELLGTIPDEEQAIVFVQSYSMMAKVEQALKARSIPAYAIDRVSESATDKIEAFVKNSRYTDSGKTKLNGEFGKVLILNLGDESASGMNLVNANHVIFLSPLLTSTSQKYHAAMVQSVGRARRYGQQRPVYVYRFMAPHSIDVDILEQRERRSTALTKEAQKMAAPLERGKAQYEAVRVVEDASLGMMVVPKSWVQDIGKAQQHGLLLGASSGDEVERFNSLSKLSEAYAQDGEA
ncbi:c-5 cytosine-specific dna [Diplodia corticola]|uniref:C-5 cytosine-specific dna n=1 Tax=Diplodia corticola TaxID=236234 RepID=A0A1J9RWK9_9PEZI|nr:c-5 cytosine-specific dna [Diplodia corticola]OJD37011.1 c-5 cytosine-specific dna [Diplodia corticola]